MKTVIDPYSKEHPNVQLENTIMRTLEKTTEFAGAMAHPIGREFFGALIELMDEKLRLIYEETATADDRAVFRACKIIGGKWNAILTAHSDSVKAATKLQMDRDLQVATK